MSAPTNHWKLGLFVVAGFVMTLGVVAWLGARSLRKEVVPYVSYFDESVQGLEIGSPIKFRGVTIGNVGKIDIAPDHRLVEVRSDLGVTELTRLGLDVAVGPTVDGPRKKKLTQTTDLRVQLASSGLTGVKFLQLDFFVVAENPPPLLTFPEPDNYIPAAASTMKNLEDSLVRTMNRLPDIVDQLSVLLSKVDGILGDLNDKQLPEQVVATLANANRILGEAQTKIALLDTGKLSKDAERVLTGLNDTVGRINLVLARVDGDKGLLASVTRASDAFGDTARGADGLGTQLEESLRSVQEAAKSIQKLANTLEKEPDMLIKGRGRGAEKNR
jgi:phospholipid/cholesterol/gamma-HCH transport system substrate-binding protein